MPLACDEAANDLLAALESPSAGESEISRRIRALDEAIGAAQPGGGLAALATLARGLDLSDPGSAGVAASALGLMLEVGHDPAPVREPLLECLRRVVPGAVRLVEAARATIPEPPEGLDDERAEEWVEQRQVVALQQAAAGMPEAADAWQRLAAIWPGAVALFSADPRARADAQDLYELTEPLESVHEGASWLRAILRVLDDEPFVAIEPATGTGIAGRLSGVAENFQLNVLLMAELPGGDTPTDTGEPRVSDAAAAVARGEGPQQIEEQVTGAWNLFTYAALGPGATLPDASDYARSDTWIWNEGTPADIPVLEGHRVILLGEAPYARAWRAQRMFVSLPASLAAEPLDEAAVAGWLERIEAAAGAG